MKHFFRAGEALVVVALAIIAISSPEQLPPLDAAVLGLLFIVCIEIILLSLALRKRFAISDDLLRDVNIVREECPHAIELVKQYRRIHASQPETMTAIAQKKVESLSETLQELEHGKFTFRRGDRQAFGRFTIKYGRESLKAVAIADGPLGRFWHTGPVNELYLKNQKDFIDRGGKITRVFIIIPENFEKHFDVFNEHVDIGVHVLIASREAVPREALEGIIIMDDNLVSRTISRADGAPERWITSVVPEEVREMRERFDRLIKVSRPYTKESETEPELVPEMEHSSPSAAEINAFIQCGDCRTQVLSAILPPERENLVADDVVQRFCDKCGKQTYWTYAACSHQLDTTCFSKDILDQSHEAMTDESVEKRMERRVNLQVPILVQSPVGEQELAKTTNLSQGGLEVPLAMSLSVNDIVSVKCPYIPDGQGLGKKAQVRHQRTPGRGDTQYYGISYLL